MSSKWSGECAAASSVLFDKRNNLRTCFCKDSGSATIFYAVLSVNTVTLGKESNFKSWDDTAKLQHCSTVSVSVSQKHTKCTSLCLQK